MRARAWPIGDRKPGIARRRAAFTLVEILVSCGVLAILGAALVGLMSAAVGAWRRGEASRQVHGKVQAARRQVEDDFAAAVVDPPYVPDFHYALDTLWDLPANPADLVYETNGVALRQPPDVEPQLAYYAPTATSYEGSITLLIRVPFRAKAAVLKARMDVLDTLAYAILEVAFNNPDAADPAVREDPDPSTWAEVDSLNKDLDTARAGGIGGAETAITIPSRGADIVFVRAKLYGESPDTAQFLRADALRDGGRPVLLLDCYRNANAVPRPPRPVFEAHFEGDTQVISFTRTIPGEMEKAALRLAGTGSCTEWLNHFDDDGGEIDEPDRLKALGGRAQVVYRYVPYAPEVGKPGLGILHRGFEAPLGRPIQDLPTHEFIPNVLYFGVSFWGSTTDCWELRPDLEPNYDPAKPRYPASQRWLSSRYLPEQVQVTLVLEPDRGQRITSTLNKTIEADFATAQPGLLRVLSTKGFYTVQRASDSTQTFLRDPRHYVKIDDEWIYYERVDSDTAFVIPVDGRGARGTRPARHEAGATVYCGTTSVFTIHVPSYRHWQR